jgi:hypothetical protein
MKDESVLFRNDCRFCEEGHLFGTDKCDFALRIGTEGKMIVYSSEEKDEVMIDYCPMCGRRLY